MSSLLELTTPVPSISSEQSVSSSSSYVNYGSDTIDLHISIGSRIQELGRIEGDSANPLISEAVVQNALAVMKAFSSEVLRKLSITDITPTNYGTLILDWYNAQENVVSVEIGTTRIGGFYDFGSGYESLEEQSIDSFFLSKFRLINTINRLYGSQLEAHG